MVKTTDFCAVLNRHPAYDLEFRRTSLFAWRILSFISGFCFTGIFLYDHCSRAVDQVDKQLNRRQYRLFRNLCDLLPEVRFIAAAGVAVIAFV